MPRHCAHDWCTPLARPKAPMYRPQYVLRALVLALAVALGFSTGAAAQTWEPTPIGTLGGTSIDSSVAEGVNGRGDVVGQSTVNGQTRAFLWTANGGMRNLGTLGGATSVALAINDAGQVVGWSLNSAGRRRAFLWTAGGGMIDLGGFPGPNPSSMAFAINNAGHIVGQAYSDSAGSAAFLWTPGSGLVSLGRLPAGGDSWATGINDAGLISCTSATSAASPCFTTASGSMTRLVPIGGGAISYFGKGLAVNNRGQIVGSGSLGTFLWLTPQSGGVPMHLASRADVTDINDLGQVVGGVEVNGFDASPSDQGWIWSESTGLYELGAGSGATEINELGVVVGYSTIDGRRQATLWRPTASLGVTLVPGIPSPQPTGQAIGFLASATGGAAPISYRFWVQPWSTGVFELAQDWSESSAFHWTPTTMGGYSIWVDGRSAGGSAVEAHAGVNFSVEGGGGSGIVPLTGISLVVDSPSPQPAGTPIVLRGVASGESRSFAYRYWARHAATGVWRLVFDWTSSGAGIYWAPSVPGDYTLAVEGRSFGAVLPEVRAEVPYRIDPPSSGQISGVTLSFDRPSPQPPSTVIRLTAQATGERPPFEYRFSVRGPNGVLRFLRDWEQSPTVLWSDSNPGVYELIVDARSSESTTGEVRDIRSFTLGSGGGGGGGGSGPMTAITLAPNLASPQQVGTLIVLTAAGTGGATPHGFRFWVQPWSTGQWAVLQDWSTVPTFAWTPSAPGGYNLAVEGRSAGATSAEVQSAIAYSIEAGGGGGGGGGGAMTGVGLAISPPAPQSVGTTITLTATGIGGTQPYAYRFSVQSWSTGVWEVLRDWSASAATSWTPTAAGGYNISVEARGSGAANAEVETVTSYEVTTGSGGGGGGVMTRVTLGASTVAPQPLGTSVTWTATGSGGSAPYSFRFWVQPWNGDWQVVRDWGTGASFVWQPTTAGGYNVAVEARSAGATSAQVQDAAAYVIVAP